MVLARWEKPIQDEAGNLITGLTVEVRDENAEGTPLATGLCSDRDGLVALGNPFSAPSGVVAFHAPGGCYSVRVYRAGTDQTFRFQPVGTAAERDIVEGTGDVSGPDDSVDNEVALFSGISGKLIKRGGMLSALWAAMVHAFTSKTTPVGADELGLIDSEAGFIGKRLTLTNLIAFLKAYFDTVYKSITGSASTFAQFDASGTWTKPASGTFALVQVWGAGGSGGRATSNQGGGGGGGGGYAEYTFLLSDLSATETVTVGAGGAARTSANTHGAAGGNSSFGTHLVGYGGGGGAGSAAGGGGGGGGLSSAGSSATSTAGGSGGADYLGTAAAAGANGVDGGGGGGAGNGGAGGSSSRTGAGGGAGYNGVGAGGIGGKAVYGGGAGGGAGSTGVIAGGTSWFGGNGGASGSGSSAAVSGSTPGGGGGGSVTGNSGAGGAGRVRVTVW